MVKNMNNKQIINSVVELIGNTPLLKVRNFIAPDYKCTILAKCEMFNPTLSVKDRIAYYILQRLEQENKLKSGYTIYEASTGNTGSAVAMVGVLLGYKVIITVPKKTSDEKINTIKSYGAEIVVCDDVEVTSDQHYIAVTRRMHQQNPQSVFINQYENQYNVDAHYDLTGPELWAQTNGKIDYFVAAGSTGGTITGVGKFLKEKNPNIKIILADPVGSIFYNHFHGHPKEPYKSYIVEGAGKDKICPIHDFSIIDDALQFNDQEAFGTAKKFARTNGILIGGSAGGVMYVTTQVIKNYNLANQDVNIVTILADSGFKYLSRNM
jgi:cystathionine beta-synthase